MQKYSNTISNYFSLLTNHIKETSDFNDQIDLWLSNNDDLFFKALTDSLFKKNLVSFPQKIIAIVHKISNCTKLYLEQLHSLFNTLEVVMKVEGEKKN